MVVVGLTGGIGSGKSTVSAALAGLGADVVDADAITRQMQEPGRPVLRAMVERFGPAILRADGTLDRQASRAHRLVEADFVIDNDGDLEALPPQIAACWRWIASLTTSPGTAG